MLYLPKEFGELNQVKYFDQGSSWVIVASRDYDIIYSQPMRLEASDATATLQFVFRIQWCASCAAIESCWLLNIIFTQLYNTKLASNQATCFEDIATAYHARKQIAAERKPATFGGAR